MSVPKTGVEKVIAVAGGKPSAVAKRLSAHRKCSRQLVEYWLRCGYVPGTWAPLVSSEFNVPLSELNPRVYPRESAGLSDLRA